MLFATQTPKIIAKNCLIFMLCFYSDPRRKLTMCPDNSETTVIRHQCGRRVPKAESREVDGEYYCDQCADEVEAFHNFVAYDINKK